MPSSLPWLCCTRLSTPFHPYYVHLSNARVKIFIFSSLTLINSGNFFLSVFPPAYDLNSLDRKAAHKLFCSHPSAETPSFSYYPLYRVWRQARKRKRKKKRKNWPSYSARTINFITLTLHPFHATYSSHITNFRSTHSWLLCPIACPSLWSTHQCWQNNVPYTSLYLHDTCKWFKWSWLSQPLVLFLLPSLHVCITLSQIL